MEKRIKYLIWGITNIGLIALFVYGEYFKVEWASNIVIPILWVVCILSIVMVIFKDEIVKKMLAENPDYFLGIHKDVENSFKIVFTLVILGFGYTTLGIFYLLHIVFINVVRDRLEELKKKGKENERN